MSLSEKVAIVLPVKNRPDHLEQCLSSLINQCFPLNGYEVLVCDDSSEDDIGKVTKKFEKEIPKIRLIRQKTAKGPAATRNMGFRSSDADIFICLDSDIVCEKDFLKRIVGALENNPTWVAAEATVLPQGGAIQS